MPKFLKQFFYPGDMTIESLKPCFYPDGKVSEPFRAAGRERSPFASDAAAQAFFKACAAELSEKSKAKTQAQRLDEARTLVREHLAQDSAEREGGNRYVVCEVPNTSAGDSDGENTLEQARADARAYNESMKEAR